jgi:hypothetical protein
MVLTDSPNGHLTIQFLRWLAEAPRSYGDAMEAWRTSCPRLSIWEDALRDGLVEIASGGGAMRNARVVLTKAGEELLRVPAD